MIDPDQALKHMQISGQVTLQRKAYWVTRYAQIKDNIFSYRKDRSEVTPRWIVDLRQCEVSRGRRDNKELFINICAPDRVTNVKVSFKDEKEFERWGHVFVESVKSDEELRRLQVLEPLERQNAQQRKLDDMHEIESRKSRVLSERKTFKKGARQLYLGKFLNLYRSQPWDSAQRQVVLDLLATYNNSAKTVWYLNEVKGSIQAFTTDRGVDLSSGKLMTEYCLQKIKENKQEPVLPPRNKFPSYAIAGLGSVAYMAFSQQMETGMPPMTMQMVLAGVIVLYAISTELHRMNIQQVHKDAVENFNKGIPMAPLPKKFGLKLTTVVCASPSEFADLLADEILRPQWELNLKQVKKKAISTLELEYVGVTNSHVVSYDFEPMPLSAGLPASFMIHEHTEKNKGMAKATSIYMLEEISGRSGSLRISVYCQVNNEGEARIRIKNLLSLCAVLPSIDRRAGVPVGSLYDIVTQARAIAGEDEVSVISEEESQEDDAIESVKGEIEQTEVGRYTDSLIIEEADNMPAVAEDDEGPSPGPPLKITQEETKGGEQKFVEDLTTPSAIISIDDVPDWDDRMSKYNYTDEQRDMVRQCIEKREAWLDFCAEGGWEVTNDDKKNGYTISQCVSANKLPCMKSTGIFDFSLMQVFACIHDSRYRTTYDTNIDTARVLSKVAANCYMIYQKTKAMLGVSSRDLVLAHNVSRVPPSQLCPKGGVLILAFTPTPEMNNILPENKDALRAFAHLCGWLLEEISPTQTKGTLMLQIDLKGGLWTSIIKKALKMQGEQIKPLRAVIQKYLNENPDCPYK